MKGFFITFEGTDGSGKSTQLRLLTQSLNSLGYSVTVTREPGGCRLSEQMRDIVLSAQNSELCPLSELLLYQAARAQHVTQVIRPALERGHIVICDRYTHSTEAYQGCARGLDEELVRKLNAVAAQGVLPDLTVMLLVPPELSFDRKGGADEQDRMEQAGADFHRAVYEGYCRMAQRDDSIFALDTSGLKKQQTASVILKEVLQRLKDAGKAE